MVQAKTAFEAKGVMEIQMEYLIAYHKIVCQTPMDYSSMLGALLAYYRDKAQRKASTEIASDREYSRKAFPNIRMGPVAEISEKDCYAEALANFENDLSMMPEENGIKNPFSKIEWWNDEKV